MNKIFMMEFTNSRSKSCEFPPRLFRTTRSRRKKPPTQTNDSQFQFSQFMKCNFFNLVAATPDAMANTSLGSPIAHHNAKATNSQCWTSTLNVIFPDSKISLLEVLQGRGSIIKPGTHVHEVDESGSALYSTKGCFTTKRGIINKWKVSIFIQREVAARMDSMNPRMHYHPPQIPNPGYKGDTQYCALSMMTRNLRDTRACREG